MHDKINTSVAIFIEIFIKNFPVIWLSITRRRYVYVLCIYVLRGI